jgi:hypothetical protein
MDVAEFADWVAFAGLEPFGSRVDDLRAGTVATAASAAWGGRTNPGEWFQWGPPRPVGDWRVGHAAFGAVAQRRGAGDGG